MAGIVIPQLALLSHGHTQPSEIHKFYQNLVQQRRVTKDRGIDYVDSYRHLREHGNAVSIVLLEVALGFILASMTTNTELLVALIVWLLPAAYTWTLGTLLEKFMVEGKLKVP